MRLSALALCVLAFAVEGSERLPVIDVHLHALPADAQGPPPLAMCTPMPALHWDPAVPYAEVFMRAVKRPQCDDPVWSPETDEEVKHRTVAVMERLNVFGVLSGTPEMVSDWMKSAPERFIPGLGFNLGPGAPSPRDA